jgi:hypothetical protein
MSNWIATNELRFVDRGLYEDIEIVLQQKWVTTEWCVYSQEFVEDEEWRDVPVVEEE